MAKRIVKKPKSIAADPFSYITKLTDVDIYKFRADAIAFTVIK